MKTPHRLLTVLLLTLVFALTASAGDMATPKTVTQPPVVSSYVPTTGDTKDMKPNGVGFVEVTFAVLQSVLSIF